MLEFLRDSYRNRSILTIAITSLVVLGFLSTLAMLFPFNREIFYEQHPVFSTCMRTAGKETTTCAARMELQVGNTGNSEESVTLVWPRYEGGWTSGHKVLNISADRRRSHDPEIHCEVDGDRQECDITRFAAGTLVVMHMDCYQCGKHEIKLLHETPLQVQTGARVFQGDPRVTVLFRRLTALAQLF